MPYYYDNLDVYRKEYNEMLLNKAATSECIVQDKYFTVTVNKKCYEDARAFFTRIEKNLSTNLFALGSKCEPLNATDRLRIFHNFYRAGNEENFNLDFELLQNQGCDVRDYISPDSMDFNSDYMMINGQYCRTVFLRNYGTFVDDNIITELTSINKNLMLSIDFIPIPVDEANKDVDNSLVFNRIRRTSIAVRHKTKTTVLPIMTLSKEKRKYLKSETICVTVTKEFMTQ